MRNIKLILQYDGSRYHGWQVQPGRPTVCGTLLRRLRIILNEDISLSASSRTDSGVHARCQVANFKTAAPIPVKNLRRALNGLLPDDIVCRGASVVPDKFNARFAVSRRYRYTIRNSSCKYPFDIPYSYFHPRALDAGLMKESSLHLLGPHDFSAFHSSAGEKINRVRNIINIDVVKRGGYVYIDVEADGFLTHMVRIIAGTLLEAGRGRFSPSDIKKILAGRDRRNAGPTLPARGLCLMRVKY